MADNVQDRVRSYLAAGGDVIPLGNGQFRARHPNGQGFVNFGSSDFGSTDDMMSFFQDALKSSSSEGIVGIDPNGNPYIDLRPQGQFGEEEAAAAEAAGVQAPPGQDSPFTNPNSVGAARARAASGGGGGGGSSGGTISRGATGGNARGSVSNPLPTVQEEGGGGMAIDTGGGGAGGPSIDPNAPLGIDFSRDGGINVQEGDPRFSSDLFPRQGDITEGLDQNSSLYDVMLNAIRTQQGQQDAALGIAGGMLSEYEADPLRGSLRQSAGDLLSNPYSLDDATVNRMLGQQGDLIGQNLERQRALSAGRAASTGVSRSGMQQADQDRLGINAANQLAGAQRGLLIEQATRRPTELANAMRASGGVLQQDQNTLERLGERGVNILRDTDITGDAAVLGTLASGQSPQINIARGGHTGPVSSAWWTQNQ